MEWLNGYVDLPQLQSIYIGGYVLNGDNGDDRKTTDELPFNYQNVLTMRSIASEESVNRSSFVENVHML